VGGRIDVVKVAPVASLVYSHGKHLISLTEMLNARGGAEPLEKHLEQGYLALSWSDAGVTYWAVLPRPMSLRILPHCSGPLQQVPDHRPGASHRLFSGTAMSALVHKQTSRDVRVTSALLRIADIHQSGGMSKKCHERH